MTAEVSSITEEHIDQASRPTDLRITDMRIAALDGVPFRSTIIRLDTNQGIVGYGEVRDQASSSYALELKQRIVGENPCNLDKIFKRIKQFGGHGRRGGGVCAVEMALMDLAGKAYGVPAYALAGGKFRERVLCYADTPTRRDPNELADVLLERMQRGYAFLKMDVGIDLLGDELESNLSYIPGALETETVMHPFAGIQLTNRGVERLAEYVEVVRSRIGYQVPLAVDHLGHIAIDSCLRLGHALEPFNLAWLEDMVPWQFTEQWRELTTRLNTPTATGEDIYLLDGFKPLLDAEAVRIIHPDPATSGGIVETKRIGDYAQERGIGMALHLAATPIATLASVHLAAATENFIALEHHGADVDGWSDMVRGTPSPLVVDGHIAVPETPGLGFEGLDDTVLESFAVDRQALFADSSAWDGDWSHDRLWS